MAAARWAGYLPVLLLSVCRGCPEPAGINPCTGASSAGRRRRTQRVHSAVQTLPLPSRHWAVLTTLVTPHARL